MADRSSGAVQRWVVRGLLGILRIYQLTFSALFTGSCRFVPSCSEYAAEAIRSHGVMRGTGLTMWRLGRCHPFAAAGHDPVPAPRSPQIHV